MILATEIQKRIARAICESRLPNAVIAQRLCVTQQAISNYAYEKKFPSLDIFANLCAVLDVDANYILCLTDFA